MWCLCTVSLQYDGISGVVWYVLTFDAAKENKIWTRPRRIRTIPPMFISSGFLGQERHRMQLFYSLMVYRLRLGGCHLIVVPKYKVKSLNRGHISVLASCWILTPTFLSWVVTLTRGPHSPILRRENTQLSSKFDGISIPTSSASRGLSFVLFFEGGCLDVGEKLSHVMCSVIRFRSSSTT